MRLGPVFGIESKFKLQELIFHTNNYATKQIQKGHPNAKITNMIFSDQHFNQRKAVAIISLL